MRRIPGFLLLLSLSGCTYASTRMLSVDTALISASDSEGSVNAVRHKALLTAARDARERGYEYFGVIGLKDGRQSQTGDLRGPILEHTMNAPAAGSSSVGFSGAETEMTVHFLHANELPSDTAAVYKVSAVLPH
jgi:hypothetical protein